MQQLAAGISSGQTRVTERNEPAVMEDLLSRGMPSFYRTAYRFLGNQADAEDAVQEAFLSAYKHLGDFRGESQLSTWVTTIVRNCARMQLRGRPRHAHVSLDEPLGEYRETSFSEQLPDHRPTPEDECKNAELKARLRESVVHLSPTLRRTFQLREMEDLSIHETAEILGVPIGTVKARLSRARKELTRSMRRKLAIQLK
ncbi:MAG TPA: sigma-70 family RNA polymerase sigma factor [Candidatus Binatia bacterium]|nr:sigma-70 family RNA polymerase sigma factor [Candidatus Binatia bacterium]